MDYPKKMETFNVTKENANNFSPKKHVKCVGYFASRGHGKC